MTNYLGIATVTATLQHLLRPALAEHMPGAEVTTMPPDGLAGTSVEKGVNIFLFQVTPNAALRNGDLPMRDARGGFVARPQVALDLHYLLTCFGKGERLEPERLLGLVAIALHGWSQMNRDEVTRAIAAAQGAFLAGSDLALQPEAIKFVPQMMTLDELHKLWAMFSPTPYRLSSVYQASVLMLDADVAPPRALPARAPRVAWTAAAPPTIDRVLPTMVPYAPGARVRLQGANFDSDTVAWIDGATVPVVLTADGELSLTLPDRGLRAGALQVSVGRTVPLGDPPAPHAIPSTDASSAAAFVLQPIVHEPVRFGLRADPRTGRPAPTVSLAPAPAPGPTQRVELLLNQLRQPPANTRTGSAGTGPGPGRDDNADADTAPALALSAAAPLRFAIRPVDVKPGRRRAVSPELDMELRQNGITLSPQARVARSKRAGIVTIVDLSSGLAYRLVTETAGMTMVYFGLTEAEIEDGVAFQLTEPPAGTYLVRYRVDGIESALTRDPATGVMTGPTVTIA